MCVYVYLEATPNLPRDYILYVSHIYNYMTMGHVAHPNTSIVCMWKIIL